MGVNYTGGKQIGKFIVYYITAKTVAISYMTIMGSMVTRLLTFKKVQDILTPIGTCTLSFGEIMYPAIIFKLPHSISHEELDRFLKDKS